MAKANYIQKDRLEEFVTYDLPRMMEEAAEFAPSWQQEATAMAVTQAWQQQVAATASTPAWQQPEAETWSTQAWQQPEAETTSTESGKDQAQTAAVTTAQTEEVESRLARSTRTNQKLVQENVRLEKEYKKMLQDNAETCKKMEQHYLRQLQDSATASSSTGAVGDAGEQGTLVPGSRLPRRALWNIGTRHQHLHGSAGDQTPDTHRVTEAAGQAEQVAPERPSPICLQETAEESPEVTNSQGVAA